MSVNLFICPFISLRIFEDLYVQKRLKPYKEAAKNNFIRFYIVVFFVVLSL